MQKKSVSQSQYASVCHTTTLVRSWTLTSCAGLIYVQLGWKKEFLEGLVRNSELGPDGPYPRIRVASYFSGSYYDIQTSGEAIAGAKWAVRNSIVPTKSRLMPCRWKSNPMSYPRGFATFVNLAVRCSSTNHCSTLSDTQTQQRPLAVTATALPRNLLHVAGSTLEG